MNKSGKLWGQRQEERKEMMDKEQQEKSNS